MMSRLQGLALGLMLAASVDAAALNLPKASAVPGGVAPQVSVGTAWPENSYKWSSLVSANPHAVLVDAFPNDGGMPAGAVMPALLLVSGDSGNLARSGKRVTALKVNGSDVLASK